MKRIKLFLGIIGLFIFTISCSDDSNNAGGQMRVFAKGTYIDPGSNKADHGFPSNDIVITSFRINVDELTLKYFIPDDDDDNGETGRNDSDGHDYKKVTVMGPWELDLLNQPIEIATVTIPNGHFKKAELELSKSLVITSPIYNKTVQITGTIDGTPFIFWHDFDQRLFLGYHNDDEIVIIHNNNNNLVFKFDLNELIDMIDLSSAVDGDNDGVIEIGPDDSDGNNELAYMLNQHFGHCGGIEPNN
jgi:hypothetical protein